MIEIQPERMLQVYKERLSDQVHQVLMLDTALAVAEERIAALEAEVTRLKADAVGPELVPVQAVEKSAA